MISHSEALSLVCVWLTSVVDCHKFMISYEKEKLKFEDMNKTYIEKEKAETAFGRQIETAEKNLKRSEELLAKETVLLNNEKDDLIYLEEVMQ
jgi:hypothetical protein